MWGGYICVKFICPLINYVQNIPSLVDLKVRVDGLGLCECETAFPRRAGAVSTPGDADFNLWHNNDLSSLPAPGFALSYNTMIP